MLCSEYFKQWINNNCKIGIANWLSTSLLLCFLYSILVESTREILGVNTSVIASAALPHILQYFKVKEQVKMQSAN